VCTYVFRNTYMYVMYVCQLQTPPPTTFDIYGHPNDCRDTEQATKITKSNRSALVDLVFDYALASTSKTHNQFIVGAKSAFSRRA
jgi:hypothetical protein